MPWKVEDVEKFKKGLTDEQKKKWVAIANGALRRCMEEEGADEVDCEASAVRIANSRVGEKEQEHTSRFIADQVVEDGDRRIETLIVFDDPMSDDTDAESDDGYQLILSQGRFVHPWFGEIIVTKAYTDRMVKHFTDKVMGERRPFIDTNHDFGASNGWIEDMRSTEEGLKVKVNWTKRGRQLVEDGEYRYFSAAWGRVTDLQGEKQYFPVLTAASLTNIPFVNTMPAAKLTDPVVNFHVENGQPALIDGLAGEIGKALVDPNYKNRLGLKASEIINTGYDPAHGDGQNNHEEESMKTLAEIIEALLTLSEDERGKVTDEQRAQLVKTFGIKLEAPKEETVELAQLRDEKSTLQETVATLSAEVKELRADSHARRRDEVIEAALEDGRILPKDRDKWVERFDKNPQFTTEVIEGLPKAIDYGRSGSSRAINPVALSDDLRKAAEDSGMEPEEAQKLLTGVFGQEG